MKKLVFFFLTLFLVIITGCSVGFGWEELIFPVRAECVGGGASKVDPFFQEVRGTAKFVLTADTNFTVQTVMFDTLVITPGSFQMFGMTEIYLSLTSDTVTIVRPSDLESETATPVTYYHHLFFYLKEVVQDK